MKTVLFVLMFAVTLFAESYPLLFAQLGTPLYKTEVQLQPLTKYEMFNKPIMDYSAQCEKALQLGKKAEQTADKKEKKAYLKKLRFLQKEYDELTVFLRKQLSQSIKNDNYALFLSMVNTEADLFFEKPKTEEAIYRYYKSNKSREKSPYLNNRIEKDKRTIVQYNTGTPNFRIYAEKPRKVRSEKPSQRSQSTAHSVIVISRPGCPYCRKAKNYLNNKNISYTEYNIRTSTEGKRLFRQHNGSGVPLVIIDGTVIRGFSAAQMQRALQ